MNEPNSPSYSLHPSNIPGGAQAFRNDHAVVEDELIEKAIARVVSKFIESIGNSMIERIQSLVPYLMVLFLVIAVWILQKLFFFKHQSTGVPSVESVREDSRVPPVVNVDDNS